MRTNPETQFPSNHYTTLAASFNEAWHFSAGYRQQVITWVVSDLDVQQVDRVVDLGGGTGIFAEMLHQQARLKQNVVCVDLCQEMLDEARQRQGVTPLCSDAFEFIGQTDIAYHKLLIKEAIHHFADRVALFRGVYRQLEPEGRMLIITRPPRTEFPFFEAAHAQFEQRQSHDSIFQQELNRAGFRVEVKIRPYPLTLPKTQWYAMLKQRFMSHLSVFSDEQIGQGILELEEHYHDTETLHFDDNLVFIICQK